MEYFDKSMALNIIEDALMEVDTLHGCGVVTGLCGAFYMCGLLNKEEWEALLARIPENPDDLRAAYDVGGSGTRGGGRVLN